MSIQFDNNTKQFHLFNRAFSYIIKIYENGAIGQVYFGEKLATDRAHPFLAPVPFTGFANNNLRSTARFEYPSYGQGDFRMPAFQVKFADGSSITEPRYEFHKIYKGKKAIPGLPATYAESEAEAETLEICLVDAPSGLNIVLFWTIFEDLPALARHVRFENEGTQKITLENALSLSLDLPDSNWNMLTFTGSWAREFDVNDAPLHVGFQGVRSTLGVSGAIANPSMIFRRSHTNEQSGEAFGISLLYSGNFLACAEVDSWDITRIRIGINPATFAWTLEPKSSFDTPEAVLVRSGSGLNGLSQAFHKLFRTRLARGSWRDQARPVLLNNWEGTYFNFTEEKLLAMASKAADLGIELFVLDDGWFGERNDDTSSLGDWFANPQKLPSGIKGLAEKIHAMGLKFGLWIEPEMLSAKSRLFEVHPDWAVCVPQRTRTEIRNQLVLDMGRSEIGAYLFETLHKLIGSAPIDYIKWDMNRFITEPFSLALAPERQGEFFHRYCLGVYLLYDRLTKAFPHILFESCASGGARFDAGMLGFAPQGWLSDDTDAVKRLNIQRGASYLYPLSCMGAHVSAVPNHQTARLSPLLFRAAVAFFGDLGFELDPEKLSDEESAAVKECIAFYKKHRLLFQQGTFTRLDTPPDTVAWMVASSDKSEAIIALYKLYAKPNQGAFHLRVTGLDKTRLYEVTFWEPEHRAGLPSGFPEGFSLGLPDKFLNCGPRGGDELEGAGLLIENTFFAVSFTGDFYPEIFLLKGL